MILTGRQRVGRSTVCIQPINALPLVNQHISTYGPKDVKQYDCTVVSIDQDALKTHILYVGGDSAFLDFTEETWKLILDPPNRVHSIYFAFHQLRKSILHITGSI